MIFCPSGTTLLFLVGQLFNSHSLGHNCHPSVHRVQNLAFYLWETFKKVTRSIDG
jgi:hypothetical protein